MTNYEKAVEFIMKFYKVSKEDATKLYADEIQAYMVLLDFGIEG